MFGKKTASGREENSSHVDGCLAGSVGLGGQGMATGCSYLVVYAVINTQSFQCLP